jgi:Predicted nucleic-acid-binding protein implicated in transcription termination
VSVGGPSQRQRQPAQRTCAGCGRKAPQAELLRFGAVDGVLQPGRTLPGRGAYTCRRLTCFERAVAQRGFNRVLRQKVKIGPALARLYT